MAMRFLAQNKGSAAPASAPAAAPRPAPPPAAAAPAPAPPPPLPVAATAPAPAPDAGEPKGHLTPSAAAWEPPSAAGGSEVSGGGGAQPPTHHLYLPYKEVGLPIQLPFVPRFDTASGLMVYGDTPVEMRQYETANFMHAAGAVCSKFGSAFEAAKLHDGGSAYLPTPEQVAEGVTEPLEVVLDKALTMFFQSLMNDMAAADAAAAAKEAREKATAEADEEGKLMLLDGWRQSMKDKGVAEGSAQWLAEEEEFLTTNNIDVALRAWGGGTHKQRAPLPHLSTYPARP
jgi:hypothetical protein